MAHQHSAVFFKETVEKSSAPLLIVDCKSGDVLYANQAAANLYGYPLDELVRLGRNTISLDPAASQKALEERIPHSELARHVKKDGTVFPVEIFRSFFDFDGNPSAGLTIFDISERLRDAQMLAEQEYRWDVACDAAYAGVWDWDIKSGHIYRSRRWHQMLGYEIGDIPATIIIWQTLVHPDDQEMLSESRRHHLEGITTIHTAEHRIKCKDGSWRWMLVSGKALRDENGTAYRMIGFLTDIQSFVDAREKLQHQNRSLDMLHKITLNAIPNSHQNIDKTLSFVAQSAHDYFVASHAYLAIYDAISDQMVNRVCLGVTNRQINSFSRGQLAAGQSWDTGEIQIIQDYRNWPGHATDLNVADIATVISVPMKAGDLIMGVLTLGFAQSRHFSSEELHILQQLALLGALVTRTAVTDQKLERLTDQSKRSSFLNMLVSGDPISRDDLFRRASAATISLKGTYIAISIERDEDPAMISNSFAKQNPWLPFMDVIQAEASPCLVWERYSTLNVLCPVDKDRTDIKQFSLDEAQRLRTILRNCLPEVLVRIGIGNNYKDVLDIHRSFHEAREALDTGRRLGGGDVVHHYLDVGIVQMLARMGQQGPIRSFVDNTIGRLLEYDNRRKGQFLPTLEMILTGKSLRIISEEMNVHQKTIVFRKMRIEEILNLPLDEGDVRLNLSIAMKLHKLAQSRESEREAAPDNKKRRKARRPKLDHSDQNEITGSEGIHHDDI